MNYKDSRLAIEALDESGLEAFSYSGRGMFGRRCVAISVESLTHAWNIALAAGAEDPEVFVVLQNPSIDNLGMNYVLYWQRLDWPGDLEDDE